VIAAWYRVILRCLPREFRDRFGAELIDTARALDRDRAGTRRRWRALGDAVALPFRLRAELRREALPHQRTWLMESLRRDLSCAVRGLRREPGFTAFVCVTLALGLGANAAMFGIADRLLLRGPAHVRDSARVVRLYSTEQPPGMRAFTTNTFGHVTSDALRQYATAFEHIATYSAPTVDNAVLGTGPAARPIRLGYASHELFELLGVSPMRGRGFTPAENAPDAASPVVLITETAASAWLGDVEGALGRTLVIDDERFEVAGILPRGFTGPQLGPVDAWIPMNLLSPRVTRDWRTTWTAQWLQIVGRLKPDVTLEAAGADATAAHRRAYAGDDKTTAAARLSVAPLRANDAGSDAAEVRVLRWLSGVALVVLLIACANIANLLLARGLRRTREVAVRAALGASRWRLVRLLLFESMLLSLAGGALGLAVAHLVGSIARRVLFANVDWSTPPVDARVLVASFGLAALTGVLVGIVPAVRASRAGLTDALKTGAREGGGRRSRLRTMLTVAQAALSVVLLVGAGLFVRSLWNVRTIDLGFDPDRVLSVQLTRQTLAAVPEGSARDAERLRRRQFFPDVIDQVAGVPGVEHVAAAAGTPFGNRFTVQLRIPGLDTVPRLASGGPSVSAVSPGYFDTMGTRILRGRGFAPGEGRGTEPIAIVSDTMARTVWPDADAIGKCLHIGNPKSFPPTGMPPCSRVVGIAENTYRGRLREDPVMHYYIPLGQEIQVGFGGTELLVRTADRSGAVAADLRRLLTSLDSTIAYVDADSIQEQRLEPQIRPWTIGATVFALSGLLAVIVAATGIYSVMSYLIADRRHEIGVRLALGARTSDIVRLVLRGSLMMAAVGVLLGEAIAAALARFVEPLLFNLSPRDPVVFMSVAGVILSIALVAALAPARRATSIPAADALRSS
jgi:predicted permease